MKKWLRLLSLPLAALLTVSSLTSCMALLIPDFRSAQSSEEEEGERIVEPKANMSPAEVYEALCCAESAAITVRTSRDEYQYRKNIRKNGGRVMVEWYSDDYSGMNYQYMESTQYYDLENKQRYFHDRNLNWSVESFEEEIRWIDILYTELVDEETVFAYEDEHYELVDGIYECKSSVLAELELERPITSLKMSSSELVYTFTYGVEFGGEQTEYIVKIEFCKPNVEFPKVEMGDSV